MLCRRSDPNTYDFKSPRFKLHKQLQCVMAKPPVSNSEASGCSVCDRSFQPVSAPTGAYVFHLPTVFNICIISESTRVNLWFLWVPLILAVVAKQPLGFTAEFCTLSFNTNRTRSTTSAFRSRVLTCLQQWGSDWWPADTDSLCRWHVLPVRLCHHTPPSRARWHKGTTHRICTRSLAAWWQTWIKLHRFLYYALLPFLK